MGEHVRAGDLDIWTEQVGQGPDVLLIGGAGDTVESWQFQLDGLADRYRLTAFDNRGAGRTAMPGGSVSAEMMADDAAQVLRASRGAASSPKSWRCAIPSWSAAWCCRAPGR
jgi:3-oxoadipate enol-lactonase